MTRTNAYSLLCVAIRVLAIYLAAKFVLEVPAAYFSLRRGLDGGGLVVPVLAPLLLLLPIAGVLWLFADRIARLALSRPSDLVFDSALESRTWLGLGISVIGAWFLFNGLVDLAYLLSKWILVRGVVSEPMVLADVRGELAPGLVATMFELVLAVVFLLRGQGLSRWVHRMRYAELPGGGSTTGDNGGSG